MLAELLKLRSHLAKINRSLPAGYGKLASGRSCKTLHLSASHLQWSVSLKRPLLLAAVLALTAVGLSAPPAAASEVLQGRHRTPLPMAVARRRPRVPHHPRPGRLRRRAGHPAAGARRVTRQGYPWWQAYQPVSYRLDSRYGNTREFAGMVEACHRAGVKVYVDAVINHMSGQTTGGTGSGGTRFGKYDYPGLYDTPTSTTAAATATAGSTTGTTRGRSRTASCSACPTSRPNRTMSAPTSPATSTPDPPRRRRVPHRRREAHPRPPTSPPSRPSSSAPRTSTRRSSATPRSRRPTTCPTATSSRTPTASRSAAW